MSPLEEKSGANVETALIEAKRLALSTALKRFEDEACQDVFPAGHYGCRFYVWGSGPPLVFIHGLGDFATAYVPIISLLAEHFRCIAYDLPAGQADGARLDRLTHAELVADLFALLDHLGMGQSYVVGSSFGSTIALAAMLAQPGRVPRAILAGGFCRRQLSVPEVLLTRLGLLLPGSQQLLPLRRAFASRAFGPLAKQRPELLDYFLEITGASPMRAMARRALMIHQTDLTASLPAIEQPVLLICGECDPIVQRTCEDALLRGLPHVGRVELSGCGHFPHYSHPEVMAEVIRQFLTPPACPAH